MKKEAIPFVKINAKNNYEFGFKLGRALSEKIKKRISANKKVYSKRSINKNSYDYFRKKARNFLPIISKNFPHILNEIKGIAKGSGVEFEDILVIICDEEIVDFSFSNHCTTIALKTSDGKFLLGHNEDWFPEFRNNGLFIVKGRINKNNFLALGYVGSLVGTGGGMNQKMAYSDTSFYFSRFEYKIPRAIHLRALLDAKTPKTALKTLEIEGSIISNTVFVFKDKGIIDIEELWKKARIFTPKDWIIHTNHPLLSKDRIKLHFEEEKESVLRYERAYEILMKQRKGYTENTIKKILSDHKEDICGHLNKKYSKDITVTIASIIMNPRDKWIKLSQGNPCKNKYKKYTL